MGHYVYESPDGGHTVYRRQIGKTSARELVSVDAETQEKLNQLNQDKMWARLRHEAKNDPALQEMLDAAEIYYKLKYEKD